MANPCLGLSGRDLIHFFDGLFEPIGLNPKDASLDAQKMKVKRYRPSLDHRSFRRVPLYRWRFLLALFWQDRLTTSGRSRRSRLSGSGVLFFIANGIAQELFKGMPTDLF